MKVIMSVPDEGYYERTRWRLLWAYLMKVILIVPDEGYSDRTWWRLFWAYLMKVILSVPHEGYSERTWWRLLIVPDEGYFLLFLDSKVPDIFSVGLFLSYL
jgi:hypothetical protein